MRGLAERRRARRDAAWLRSSPWAGAELPPDVDAVPTMLSVPERRLLYVLARDYVRPNRAIIDLGCFLGGSTIALAAGLAESKHAVAGRAIHTYDLFDLDGVYKHAYPGLVEDINVGGSLRPRFEELLGPLLAHVEVHAGDVCREHWTGEPIDVLFIDICKSWEINDHVLQEFFPSLLPGRSVVIQQDLIHEWLPYLTVTMGLLTDSFDLVGVAAPCSAIYLNTRRVEAPAIPPTLRALDPARKLELFDRGCAPFVGEDRGVVECSRAVLLCDLGLHKEAIAHLDATVAANPESERVKHAGSAIGQWLAMQPDAGRP